MARSTPTPVTPTVAGTVVTMGAAPVDGDILPVGPNVALLVTNGGGSPITVTIQTTAEKAGLAVADAGGAVANGTSRIFGPFPASLFAQADDAVVGANKVLVDYSAITSVTRAVIQL
jgi:hypothetical protein